MVAMISSLSIGNSLAPGVTQNFAQKPEHEKPEQSRRLPPDKVPQILDLEASRMMEQRLARRAERGLEQENFALQSRRAVSAYGSLAADEERGRISGMLGINLFA